MIIVLYKDLWDLGRYFLDKDVNINHKTATQWEYLVQAYKELAAIIHLNQVISQDLQWQTHLTFIRFSEKKNYVTCKIKQGKK